MAKQNKNIVLWIIVLAVAIYFVGPQLGLFSTFSYENEPTTLLEINSTFVSSGYQCTFKSNTIGPSFLSRPYISFSEINALFCLENSAINYSSFIEFRELANCQYAIETLKNITGDSGFDYPAQGNNQACEGTLHYSYKIENQVINSKNLYLVKQQTIANITSITPGSNFTALCPYSNGISFQDSGYVACNQNNNIMILSVNENSIQNYLSLIGTEQQTNETCGEGNEWSASQNRCVFAGTEECAIGSTPWLYGSCSNSIFWIIGIIVGIFILFIIFKK